MARDIAARRIEAWLATLGMTHQELADRIGKSRQHVSLIVAGKRRPNLDLLADIAVALDVGFQDLTGQPYPAATRGDAAKYQLAQLVRDALDAADDDQPVTPRPLDELAQVTDLAMSARMHCDTAALATHLPGLLTETHDLWFRTGNGAAGRLLVKAAFTGSLVLKSAGWVDLAKALANKAHDVAQAIGDPVCIAAARFTLAQYSMAVGARQRSINLSLAGITDLASVARNRLPERMNNEVLGWLTMLHLQGALSVASVDQSEASAHLAAAEVAA